MGDMDIAAATYGNITGTGTDYSVKPAKTDAATGQKETTWINEKWGDYLGYYIEIPELAAVVDAKAIWTVGKGYKADKETTFILDKIRGNGFDTFNSILENNIRTYHIGGDSYNEIVRDKKGNLINLKPLDPSRMRHVMNPKGRIIRFEYLTVIGKKTSVRKFKPEEIFYLARNRVADEVHGQSMVRTLVNIILMRNEAMEDMRILMHRHVKPAVVWHLDTDVPSEIATFKANADKATDKGENHFIPMGAAEHTLLSVPPNATLSPLSWIESLNNYFYEASQVPRIVVGGTGGYTEAAVKIAYVSFEQPISSEQLYVEEQTGLQLGLAIDLEFPVSLVKGVLSGMSKEESTQAATPEDVTAEEQGVKA